MSKYIKLEDAIHNINLEVIGRKEYTGDMKANLFFALDDLPTIEVSDKADRPFEYFEGYEDGRKSVEVSEDCISRDWVYNALTKVTAVTPTQIDMLSDFTDIIKNAPSVTTEQSSKVGEWIDYYYPHFEVAGIECSVCGEDIPYWDRHYKEPRFCPNCGSRMKG